MIKDKKKVKYMLYSIIHKYYLEKITGNKTKKKVPFN